MQLHERRCKNVLNHHLLEESIYALLGGFSAEEFDIGIAELQKKPCYKI